MLARFNYQHLDPIDLSTLISAYLYGGYSIAEIKDTLYNGPRAVHPTIPADIWRKSAVYQTYSSIRI